MLINSEKIENNAVIDVDLCIIGSGAAGLSIASEFLDSNITIAILESGDRTYQETAQAFNQVECSALGVGPRARIRQYGGSTTAWSGKWVPMSPFDLKVKPWIENSGWPIKYEDLVQYYERASKLHNGPKFKASSDLMVENSGAETSTKSSFLPIPVHWLKVGDLDFSLTIGKLVQRSKNIKVYFSVTVANIQLTESLDSIDYVEANSKSGKQFKVKARQFVLAGGGIENARLLLASNSQLKDGIGNRFGNLGRYYMDHPKGFLATVHLEKGHRFPDCLGLSNEGGDTHRVDIGVRLSDDLVESNKTVNSYLLWHPQAEQAPSPSLRKLFSNLMIIKTRPTQWKTYFDVIKNLIQLEKKNFFQVIFYRLSLRLGLKSHTPSIFKIEYHIEQVPSSDNRVALSDERDIHDQPLAALHWALADIETLSIKRLHMLLAELLEKTQTGKLTWDAGAPPDFDNLIIDDSSHHMGTTRMGNDEKTSVVDHDCKVHGIQNLYVAGSSVFPTSGFANPTFTIVALAIRLADKLKKILR